MTAFLDSLRRVLARRDSRAVNPHAASAPAAGSQATGSRAVGSHATGSGAVGSRPANRPIVGRRASLVDPWLLLAIGLAVVLRIALFQTLGRDLRITDPVIDGKLYLEQARRLASSGGAPFPEPWFQSPLYPFELGLLFRILPPLVHTVWVAQMVLGIAALVVLYVATRRHLGMPAARIAVVLLALCGPVLALESQVLQEPTLFALACLALLLWPAGGQPRSDPTGRRSAATKRPVPMMRTFGFGIVCGMLAVGRGTFLLLPLFALAGLFLPAARHRESRTLGQALLLSCVLAAGTVLPLLPLAAHQTRTTGSFQALPLNGGLNLFIGNNPAARGIYADPPGLDLEQDFTGRRLASHLAERPLDLVQTSAFYREQAFAFWQEQPGRSAWLLSRKALLYLSPREIPQIENFAHLARDAWPLRAAFAGFGWILALAVAGCVLTLRTPPLASRPGSASRRNSPGGTSGTSGASSPGRAGRPSGANGPSERALLPFFALVLTGWITTIAFFAAGRFRLPFLPGFLGLAAYGAWQLWESRRDRRRLALGLGAGLAVAALLPLLPTYPIARAEAFADLHLGMRYAQHGEHDRALANYERALAADSTLGEAWHARGVSLAELGRTEEAIAAYRRASAHLTHPVWTRYNLGLCLTRVGRPAEALDELEAALEMEPRDPRIHHQLALALIQLGRAREAQGRLEKALSLDPGFAPAIEALRGLGDKPAP